MYDVFPHAKFDPCPAPAYKSQDTPLLLFLLTRSYIISTSAIVEIYLLFYSVDKKL